MGAINCTYRQLYGFKVKPFISVGMSITSLHVFSTVLFSLARGKKKCRMPSVMLSILHNIFCLTLPQSIEIREKRATWYFKRRSAIANPYLSHPSMLVAFTKNKVEPQEGSQDRWWCKSSVGGNIMWCEYLKHAFWWGGKNVCLFEYKLFFFHNRRCFIHWPSKTSIKYNL